MRSTGEYSPVRARSIAHRGRPSFQLQHLLQLPCAADRALNCGIFRSCRRGRPSSQVGNIPHLSVWPPRPSCGRPHLSRDGAIGLLGALDVPPAYVQLARSEAVVSSSRPLGIFCPTWAEIPSRRAGRDLPSRPTVRAQLRAPSQLRPAPYERSNEPPANAAYVSRISDDDHPVERILRLRIGNRRQGVMVCG